MNARRVTSLGIAAGVVLAGIIAGCSGETTVPNRAPAGTVVAGAGRSADAQKIAAYHSAMVRAHVRDARKWLAARPRARTAAVKARYREQLCDMAIERAVANLPMLGAQFAGLSAQDKRTLSASLKSNRQLCHPGEARGKALGRNAQMSIFAPTSTVWRAQTTLICDPLQAPTYAPNDCITDALDQPFDALLDGLASLTTPSVLYTPPGSAFTDLTSGVLGAYAGSLAAADFAVLADVDGIAASSEEEWTSQIAPDLVRDLGGSYDESSIFRRPLMLQESEDPCRNLVTDGNDTKCSIKIIRNGLAADIGGCFGGVKMEKQIQSLLGKLVKRVAARSICGAAAAIASGSYAIDLYIEYW